MTKGGLRTIPAVLSFLAFAHLSVGKDGGELTQECKTITSSLLPLLALLWCNSLLDGCSERLDWTFLSWRTYIRKAHVSGIDRSYQSSAWLRTGSIESWVCQCPLWGAARIFRCWQCPSLIDGSCHWCFHLLGNYLHRPTPGLRSRKKLWLVAW